MIAIVCLFICYFLLLYCHVNVPKTLTNQICQFRSFASKDIVLHTMPPRTTSGQHCRQINSVQRNCRLHFTTDKQRPQTHCNNAENRFELKTNRYKMWANGIVHARYNHFISCFFFMHFTFKNSIHIESFVSVCVCKCARLLRFWLIERE